MSKQSNRGYRLLRRLLILLAGIPFLSGLSSCTNSRVECKYGGPADYKVYNDTTEDNTEEVNNEDFDLGTAKKEEEITQE